METTTGTTSAPTWRFLGKHVADSDTFTPQQLAEIREAVTTIISDYDHPDVSGDGNPYYLLSERVVDWCIAHPDPLPLPDNQTLQRTGAAGKLFLVPKFVRARLRPLNVGPLGLRAFMNTLPITLISVAVILLIVGILKKFTSGWKLFIILWLPIFAATMWYGIAHDFQATVNIGVYAVAMALAAWGIAGWAIHTVSKWQEWPAVGSNSKGSRNSKGSAIQRGRQFKGVGSEYRSDSTWIRKGVITDYGSEKGSSLITTDGISDDPSSESWNQ